MTHLIVCTRCTDGMLRKRKTKIYAIMFKTKHFSKCNVSNCQIMLPSYKHLHNWYDKNKYDFQLNLALTLKMCISTYVHFPICSLFIISLHLQQQKYIALDDHDHNSHSVHVWSWYMLCGCSLMVLKIFSSNRLKKKMNNKFEFQNNTNHIIILGLISILDSSCWVFAK